MGYVGTKPTAAPLTSAQLEDGLVTAAKLATDAVETAKVKDLNVTNAKIAATTIDVTAKITGTVPTANLGSGSASSTTILYGDQTYKTEPAEYDDNVVQSNIAMLGFKVAVNGSLTRYNLVDQSIDEFFDTSGVDASASTNDARVASGDNYYYWGATGSNPTGGDSTDTSVAGYTTHVFTTSRALTVGTAGDVDILVVGGGASGGAEYGGGGGAGGLIYKGSHGLTANTYDAVIGDGGAYIEVSGIGNSGVDTTWTINGGAQEFIAKGGGYGSKGSTSSAGAGGSGGGLGYQTTTVGASNQSAQSGDSGTYGFGNAGGPGSAATNYNTGGGGGAGSAGSGNEASQSGDGGTGKDYSAIFGTVVGDSGWFASGGGGGATTDGNTQKGTASAGGGTDGGSLTTDAVAAQANTGGGGGGGSSDTAGRSSGAGGSGVILVRYADDEFQTIGDLTLQSTDVTALSAPTHGEFVTLIENAYGTATLNTDIKGYISRDSGVTFTQGTLVDEGTWGTNKKVLGFHDLAFGGSALTAMCYKITTHNQVASSLETRVYATSIGWR